MPIHQFLFALSPILFLFTHNAATLPLSLNELILPGLISLGGTLVLWLFTALVLKVALRRGRGVGAKAGLITTGFVLFFFLFGHSYNLIRVRSLRPEWLVPVWILLLVILIWRTVRSKGDLRGFTKVLNVIAGAVLLTNIVIGLPHFLRNAWLPTGVPVQKQGRVAGQDYPDIYYIILDAFGRDDFLKDNYGVDAAPFLDALTRKGFYVARRSRPNYSQTYLSLASSLNYTYLDSIGEIGEDLQARQSGSKDASKQGRKRTETARVGVKTGANRVPLTRMIADSRVVRFLKARGYTTMAFASGYAGTELKNADIYLAPRWSYSEFQNVLLSTTPLPLLLNRIGRKSQADQHRGVIRYALENLPRGALARKPVFVFAHIVCPHPPFVFGRNGESVNPPGVFVLTEGGEFQVVDKKEVREDYVRRYADQITYLMGQVEQTVSRILAASPKPPVIILQADHGPGSFLNWDDPSWSALSERFGILNAYHLPETGAKAGTRLSARGHTELYDSITPVNTFRVVFNRVFDAGLPLLPDRSYFSTITKPYEFFDITDSSAYVNSRGMSKVLSVLAFPADDSPIDHASYCRRLVGIKYRETGMTVKQFYVKPVGEVISAEQAVQLYQRYVQSGNLPDLGDRYEVYQGAGPDKRPVTALFFR